MNFTNLLDIIQVFANEWCKPQNNILIITKNGENGESFDEIKKLFKFINCETFIVSEIGVVFDQTNGIDFQVNEINVLPFEEQSFDVVINFNLNFNNYNYLKQGGVIITKEYMLDAKCYYRFNQQLFSVL